MCVEAKKRENEEKKSVCVTADVCARVRSGWR